MNQAGAFLDGDVVTLDDPEGAPVALIPEIVERWNVFHSNQIRSPGASEDTAFVRQEA